MRKIIADSSCDLGSTENIVNGVDFSVVPLKVLVEDKEFVDDSNLNLDEMLETLANTKEKSSTACQVQWNLKKLLVMLTKYS